MPDRGRLCAVTFDCWNTLLYEEAPDAAQRAREQLLAQRLGELGVECSPEQARQALHAAWRRHWEEWKRGVATGSGEMAHWALVAFGIHDGAVAEALGHAFAEVALGQEVRALTGAGETLETLARRGIRRGLICDTGFSPARVVRELLARSGLLELLEVQIFSDEAGVPKPDARVFRAALEPLGVQAEEALHVGDLRRTDIAGARAVGMGSIRIRSRFDDASALPDADAVADSHAHLLELLAGRTGDGDGAGG
ncbi:MAG: HAD family hydrolase [Myxococcota bacterium]